LKVELFPAISQDAIVKELQAEVDAGQGWACDSLGSCYVFGRGVPKDYEKALAVFNKGVAAGDPDCAVQAARFYRSGTVVPKDIEKAKSLLQLPVKLGISSAELELGELYFFDDGKPEGVTEAIRLYELAASKG